MIQAAVESDMESTCPSCGCVLRTERLPSGGLSCDMRGADGIVRDEGELPASIGPPWDHPVVGNWCGCECAYKPALSTEGDPYWAQP